MQYMLPLLNMEAAPPPPSSKPPPLQQQLMRTVSISILVMSLPVLYVSFLHVPPASLFRDTAFWFLMSNSIIIVIAADSGMLFFRSSSSPSCPVDADADDGLSFVVSGGEPAEAKNSHASSTGVSVADEVVLPVDEVIKNQALVVREHGDLTVIAENDDHAYALVVRDNDHRGELQAASNPEAARGIKSSSPAGADEPLAAEDVDGGGAARTRPRLTASRSLAREERARRRHGHRPPSHSHALVPVQDKRVVVVREEKRQLRRSATAAEEAAEKESEYSRLSDEELNRRVEEFITKFNREIRMQLEKEQLALAAAY